MLIENTRDRLQSPHLSRMKPTLRADLLDNLPDVILHVYIEILNYYFFKTFNFISVTSLNKILWASGRLTDTNLFVDMHMHAYRAVFGIYRMTHIC